MAVIQCCVLKFLWLSVDGKHLMRFQSEIPAAEVVEQLNNNTKRREVKSF